MTQVPILKATDHNVGATVTSHPGIVHPCINDYIPKGVARHAFIFLL